jgi:ABC-type microcin C transport system permease subunit YejE
VKFVFFYKNDRAYYSMFMHTFLHICAYFSAFLAKKRAYICAYFLHFLVHIIRALVMELFGNSGTPVGTLKDAEFKKL